MFKNKKKILIFFKINNLIFEYNFNLKSREILGFKTFSHMCKCLIYLSDISDISKKSDIFKQINNNYQSFIMNPMKVKVWGWEITAVLSTFNVDNNII